MKDTATRPRLMVTGDGKNVVGHAGARLLSDVADALGLTEGLSAAMAPTKQRRGGHDRGQVLTDLAVTIAGGGETISELAVLRNQPALFGQVASTPTAWRTLEAIDTAALHRIADARAAARARAWAAGKDPGFYVIDFDATLVIAHSDKEQAAPNYKRTFGFHPLLAFLDATGEALGGILRPGNASPNTAADHVTLLAMALRQLPVDPAKVEVIARGDSGALTHGFVNACRDAGVRFSIGFDLTEKVRTACLSVPPRRWQPAVTADGADERDGADVAEITDLLDLSRWPVGTRAIVRREEPHAGAQLTFTDIDGHRFQVFITDLPDDDIAYLEALQRGRGRAEKQICNLKDTGLANLPSANFAINQAWLTTALIAHDLLAWTRMIALDGDLAAPNRRSSATASCTPPASSPAPAAAPGSASLRPGHGSPISSTRSNASSSSPCASDHRAAAHRRPQTHTTPAQPANQPTRRGRLTPNNQPGDRPRSIPRNRHDGRAY